MSESQATKDASAPLLKLLRKLKLLNESEIERNFTDAQMGPIAHFAALGLLDENRALQAVSEALSLPALVITKTERERIVALMNEDRFYKLPLAQWRKLRAVPVALQGDRATIAFANPLDHAACRLIEFTIGCPVEVAVAKEHEIAQVHAAKVNSHMHFDLEQLVERQEEEAPLEIASSDDATGSALSESDHSAPPVIRLVDKIFSQAIQEEASDIHITPQKETLVVKIRVDGMLRVLFTVPRAFIAPVISRIKILGGMDIAERRKPQDGRVRILSAVGAKDLRLSTVPTIYGENIVARILSSSVTRTSFESLGMAVSLTEQFRAALRSSSRVVLVTGPTGSGKTSTLYAALLTLADGQRNVITIEDPIEYRIQGVQQIQVNPRAGLSFQEGLRSVLRQDPDVIMVGEIRDAETASTAMQAAQTGHLILSTLHTNSAAAAITRLRDLGVPSYLIASSWGGCLAQRLVRRVCSECSQPAGESYRALLEMQGIDATKAREAKGCVRCDGSGYLGRIGIFSFIAPSEELREAIRNEAPERTIEELAKKNGFVSLACAAVELLSSGETTLEEMERVLGSSPATIKTTESSVAREEPPVPSPEAPLSKQRILLVEDDENTRTVLAALLRRALYEVEEASDGYEALEKVYQKLPGLIVCDLMMPRMDGHEVVKRLRDDARTRHIPVLILTAAATEENELGLLDEGASDFVSKTANSRVMLARINRLLERSQNTK